MAKLEWRQWVGEKRDILAVVVVLVLIGFSIVFSVMMKGGGNDTDTASETLSVKENALVATQSSAQSGPAESGGVNGLQTNSSFFLEPSPAEVLTLIQEMGDQDLPATSQTYTGLKVLWPVYYFQVLRRQLNMATVLLDVSEDGFGVTIETDIDISIYPEVLELEQGQKIWLAGEIQGVDMAGTGSIYLRTEHVRYQENLLDELAPFATEGTK